MWLLLQISHHSSSVAQPVKQGNSHQLCFSLRQRPGRGAEDVGPGGNASAFPHAAGLEPSWGSATCACP